jgi:hypothetical protein
VKHGVGQTEIKYGVSQPEAQYGIPELEANYGVPHTATRYGVSESTHDGPATMNLATPRTPAAAKRCTGAMGARRDTTRSGVSANTSPRTPQAT